MKEKPRILPSPRSAPNDGGLAAVSLYTAYVKNPKMFIILVKQQIMHRQAQAPVSNPQERACVMHLTAERFCILCSAHPFFIFLIERAHGIKASH